jgi:hypothetical protein
VVRSSAASDVYKRQMLSGPTIQSVGVIAGRMVAS